LERFCDKIIEPQCRRDSRACGGVPQQQDRARKRTNKHVYTSINGIVIDQRTHFVRNDKTRLSEGCVLDQEGRISQKDVWRDVAGLTKNDFARYPRTTNIRQHLRHA
jgi:hypothetical protein